MCAQRIHKVALLLVVVFGICAVHCRHVPPGRGDSPPSPPSPPPPPPPPQSSRCVAASVTPVSCSQVQSYRNNLLPHPDDCELFYYCVNPEAQPICRQCPAHLHFNPRLRVCDHPDRAGCRAPHPTGPPITTGAEEVTTDAPTEVTETTTSEETTTAAA